MNQKQWDTLEPLLRGTTAYRQCSCSYTVEIPDKTLVGVFTNEELNLKIEEEVEEGQLISYAFDPDDVVEPEPDMINPDHYKSGGLEVIDVIDAFGLDGDGYLMNVVKYILRCGRKDDNLQELKKAQWYLDRRIQRLEEDLA